MMMEVIQFGFPVMVIAHELVVEDPYLQFCS